MQSHERYHPEVSSLYCQLSALSGLSRDDTSIVFFSQKVRCGIYANCLRGIFQEDKSDEMANLILKEIRNLFKKCRMLIIFTQHAKR